MPTIAELEAQVDDLQTTLDAEQQQVADDRAAKDAAIAALTQANADLQAIIDAGGGGDPAALQRIADKIAAIKTDLQATIAP